MTSTTASSNASSTPAPPPAAPTAPHLAAQTPRGAYPLHLNSLTSLVAYHSSAAGLSITSLVSLPADSVFCKITTSTPAPLKRWSTVQTSRDTHLELNSALLYMNHSCRPNLVVDVERMEVRVVSERRLEKGEELSFFYPSTEWEFDNPFDCVCGAGEACLGRVRGAKFVPKERRGTWWWNKHIVELFEEEDAKGKN